MKTKKTIPFVFALWIFIISIHAQEKGPVEMQMPEGRYEISNALHRIVIPFKPTDHLIIIQVELNGKILNLILDSGMPMEGALLFGNAKVNSTNLNFSAKMPVGGVGGDAILSDLSVGATLTITDLKMTNQMIIVMPHDPARSLRFDGIDGIIGFSLFANFVVEIDYEKQQLVLTKPEAFSQTEMGQKIPIEVRGNRIFLTAQVELENGSSVPVELVVDTGNRSALILNTVNQKELVLPSKVIPYFARGLSKKLNLKVGRIRTFTMGHYTLTNVLSSFNDGAEGPPPPWEKEGNVGNEILRRFNVLFDIPGKQIYLVKNKYFSELFELNMAGIQFESSEDSTLTVNHVIPDSPAQKALMLPGDKIISINNRLISQCTKDEIEKELKKPGNEVSLVIKRTGKIINARLRLTRLI